MSKKNILFISSRSDIGGGPKHLYQLVCNLDYKQYNAFIACPINGEFYSKFLELVGQANMFYIPHRKFQWRDLLKLVYLCKLNKINIIHSHGKGAGVYSRLLKIFCPSIRIIHTFHGIHYKDHGLVYKIFYFFIERFFSLLTHRVICVSDGEKKEVISNNIVINREKVVVIYNGVSVPSQYIHSNIHDKVHFVVVSRFDYQKNTPYLIDVMKAILEKFPSKVFFDVLGEGDDLNLLLGFISNNNLEEDICFHGNVLNVTDFYKKSDFILNTSRWEGLPLSIIEASAYGCVPILTNVVGNRDILEKNPSMGCLFNDVGEIIYFLEKCFDNHDFYKTCRYHAFSCVNDFFNESVMCSSTYQLYHL